MSEPAKSLLNQIRNRRSGGGNFFHPSLGPVSLVGGQSPLDEMLELYIAAREQEDQASLRKELEELKLKYRDVCASKREQFEKLQEVSKERDDALARKQANQEILWNLLRVGDVVCVEKSNFNGAPNTHKSRHKISEINRDTGHVSYVNWDTRRKAWGFAPHSENIELLALGSRSVIQIERSDDKELTKARKIKSKPKEG